MLDGQTESQHQSVTLALTGGTAPGSRLREKQVFQITRTGVVFHGDMTRDQWLEGMQMLRWFKNAAPMWLADFISHGTARFGEEVVQETLVQLQFDLVDAQHAIAITSLDQSTRRLALSSEHYWVIAEAKLSPEDQAKWADLTIEHRLSALLLKKSIAAGKLITRNELAQQTGRGSGIATLQGMRQTFEMWFRKTSQDDPVDTWDRERKLAAWEELKGPTEIGLKLARELGINLGDDSSGRAGEVSAEDEELVQKCIGIMKDEGRVSTSLFQRRLRLGYTRAARIIDILEQRGYVGPGEGAAPRQIIRPLD